MLDPNYIADHQWEREEIRKKKMSCSNELAIWKPNGSTSNKCHTDLHKHLDWVNRLCRIQLQLVVEMVRVTDRV